MKMKSKIELTKTLTKVTPTKDAPPLEDGFARQSQFGLVDLLRRLNNLSRFGVMANGMKNEAAHFWKKKNIADEKGRCQVFECND